MLTILLCIIQVTEEDSVMFPDVCEAATEYMNE